MPTGEVTVRLHAAWHGDLAECCMEFSALDRLLYNLVNNAARHAADGQVEILVVPVDDSGATHARIAVANLVTAEQRLALVGAYGDELGQLVRGGFTTGGHGLGMQIAADFVVHGYGLRDVEQALRERYLGVTLVDRRFVACPSMSKV